MTIAEEWTKINWHCANCGSLVEGYKNPKGDIKIECTNCKTVMVRRFKSRRHTTIDIYVPEVQYAI